MSDKEFENFLTEAKENFIAVGVNKGYLYDLTKPVSYKEALKHLQTFLPGLKDPRFSDEQKKKTALTILPTTGASDKSHLKLVTPIHEDKPTKNSKILNNIRKLNAAKIEEKPDELRDLRDATVE